MDFDYKKYSLENLEKWIEDALNSTEASPQKIYDCIHKVVEENYYCYKNQTSRCYELLALLNGNGNSIMKGVKAHGELWDKEDKVVKWQLPVEVDGISGEYYIQFPDDLMEASDIGENDLVEWIDQGNGSYILKKVNNSPSWVEGNKVAKTKTYDEMIAEGWTMTADGFWIKETMGIDEC